MNGDEIIQAILLELLENKQDEYIYKLNFINELSEYVLYSDKFSLSEFKGMPKKALLKSDKFKKFVGIVYDKFIESDEYNLYKFMDDLVWAFERESYSIL